MSIIFNSFLILVIKLSAAFLLYRLIKFYIEVNQVINQPIFVNVDLQGLQQSLQRVVSKIENSSIKLSQNDRGDITCKVDM